MPDGYEIGYKSVKEIAGKIEHKFYKMKGYTTEYQMFSKKDFSMDDDLERFFNIPMNKKKRRLAVVLATVTGSAVLVLSGCSGKSEQTEKTCGSE